MRGSDVLPFCLGLPGERSVAFFGHDMTCTSTRIPGSFFENLLDKIDTYFSKERGEGCHTSYELRVYRKSKQKGSTGTGWCDLLVHALKILDLYWEIFFWKKETFAILRFGI